MNMQDAIKAQAAALTRLSTETTTLEAAGVALQEAEEAFAREGGDERWAEVEAKQSAYRRAQLTRKGAKEAADAATAKVRELEADAAAAKKAEAASRSTVEAFRKLMAPHLEKIVAQHVASAEAIGEIQRLVQQQNADAETAGLPAMTIGQARGYVLAALESSEVPPEIGALLNRVRPELDFLGAIASLIGGDAEHFVSAARSARSGETPISTDATARTDIARLLDGTLEQAVRKRDLRRIETDQQGREAAAARDDAQRMKQAADRAGRHGPAAA